MAATVATLMATATTTTDAQSMLTAPVDCAESTLQIQDTSDVAILCDGLVVEKAPFNGVTTLEIGIKSASLVMKALVSDTLTTLYVHTYCAMPLSSL